jgi:hypothetical protein
VCVGGGGGCEATKEGGVSCVGGKAEGSDYAADEKVTVQL